MISNMLNPAAAAGRSRRGALLAVTLAASLCAHAAELRPDSDIPPAGALSGPSLVERLAQGGLVLYVRHERTTAEPVERHAPVPRPGCEKSNNLGRAGGERALANRTALRQLGLPIGKVFSSPYCRTTETAMLMFGADPQTTALLASVHATQARGPAQMREDTQRLIAQESVPGWNLVLVGHREGIMALTGADLNTGDTAVLEPVAGAAPRLIGFISALRWTQLGADAARREALAKAAAR